jgi:hypothetical protein
VSDVSLAPGDPTRTIHFFVGRAFDRLSGDDETEPWMGADSALEWAIGQDTPDLRRSVGYSTFAAAWFALSLVFVGLMVVIAIPAGLLFGAGVAGPIAKVLVAGCFFCLAGEVNVLWRTMYYVPKARRLAAKGESDRDAYAAAMRRTLPRNSSLVFQTAAFVVTLLVWL